MGTVDVATIGSLLTTAISRSPTDDLFVSSFMAELPYLEPESIAYGDDEAAIDIFLEGTYSDFIVVDWTALPWQSILRPYASSETGLRAADVTSISRSVETLSDKLLSKYAPDHIVLLAHASRRHFYNRKLNQICPIVARGSAVVSALARLFEQRFAAATGCGVVDEPNFWIGEGRWVYNYGVGADRAFMRSIHSHCINVTDGLEECHSDGWNDPIEVPEDESFTPAGWEKRGDLDLNGLVSLYLWYMQHRDDNGFPMDWFRTYVKSLSSGGAGPLVRARERYAHNRSMLDQELLQNYLDILTPEPEVLYISLTTGVFLRIDSCAPEPLVLVNQDESRTKNSLPLSAEESADIHMGALSTLRDDLALRVRHRQLQMNENRPIALVAQSTDELVEILHTVNVSDLLHRDEIALSLHSPDMAKRRDVASLSVHGGTRLAQLFDGNVVVVNLNSGLSDQITKYIFGRLIERETGARVIYDDLATIAEMKPGYHVKKDLPLVVSSDISDRLISKLLPRSVVERLVRVVSRAVVPPLGSRSCLDSSFASMTYLNAGGIPLVPHFGSYAYRLYREHEGATRVCRQRGMVYMPDTCIQQQVACTPSTDHIPYFPYARSTATLTYETASTRYNGDSRSYISSLKEVYEQELAFSVEDMPSMQREVGHAIGSSGLPVGIHVRRGDFVNLGRTVDPAWYRRQIRALIDRFEGEDFSWWIFTDDIPHVRANAYEYGITSSLPGGVVFVDVGRGIHSYRDMQLLSLCKVFVTPGNSGFSAMAFCASHSIQLLVGKEPNVDFWQGEATLDLAGD